LKIRFVIHAGYGYVIAAGQLAQFRKHVGQRLYEVFLSAISLLTVAKLTLLSLSANGSAEKLCFVRKEQVTKRRGGPPPQHPHAPSFATIQTRQAMTRK